MKDREVLIAITGGIAAYKTAALVSQLVQAGARVSVAMTRAAQAFVGPATLAALTGRPVATDVFQSDLFPLGAHIVLAQRAELLCVAPATADFLAKAAHGLADDLVSTLYLSFAGPVLVAPAMNPDMWAKPVVQRNVAQLRDDGVTILVPDDGWLSCRRQGPGRMAEPDRIQHAIETALGAMH
ncbi:MAG: phosphopantothenoylcysteine decarboxylase [Pirellulaceae bacterium]|jgi:phosphopantothenoylcysteine decarboxylase/phosphopantothenate--cysteine ligase|nr:phosphopantothenoylcysteine decarboxylase [Pirellulaceae bacterium]